MENRGNYKNSIYSLLIKGKGYRDPNFSAKILAERLGISSYTLSRLLRTHYEMTYSELVHAYRIRDAIAHLEDRRLAPYSIDDIGRMVGFKNRQSFFASFKKATGTTPEKYRSMLHS